MRFNSNELEMAKNAIEMFVQTVEDQKMKMLLLSFVDKCQMCIDMRLSLKMTDRLKERCDELFGTATEMIREYAGYSGDMGMINEYDRMKKEVAVIADSIGDADGTMRANEIAAKRELEVIFERIKGELVDEGIVKTNAEAERKAKMDSRYIVALEDYRELLVYTGKMKNKFKSIVDTRDDLRQSVSTSRNSIIAEGYNR